MGIEPGSPAWKTSITPLQTVESYWKYNIHYRLAMSTNADYMKQVRIKSQPKEEVSRSAVYAKYTSLQSMEY